jgi:excisionase family DNA binding protein
MEKLFVRPIEAAQMLGISRSKLYEMLAAEQIPSIRMGGVLRIPLAALKKLADDAMCARDEA